VLCLPEAHPEQDEVLKILPKISAALPKQQAPVWQSCLVCARSEATERLIPPRELERCGDCKPPPVDIAAPRR
jgi:hypothetical protein